MVLPPGWEEAIDPSSGRKYYANRSTQETRWDPPPPISPVVASTSPPAQASLSKSKSSRSPSIEQSKGSSTGDGSGTSKSNPKPNKFYSAPETNVATSDPGQLVSMTRRMLEKSAAFPDQTEAVDLELHSVTPGQIADLCKLQRESVSMRGSETYTPLNPYRLSTTKEVRQANDNRMDMRVKALHEKLKDYVSDEEL